MVPPQVRRQLVRPCQAQHQIGYHQVVVESPLKEQLAAKYWLGNAAFPLTCTHSPLQGLLQGATFPLQPACVTSIVHGQDRMYMRQEMHDE